MDTLVLQAEPRGTGRHQIRELREAARVPAVVYGVGRSPEAVSVEARALHLALVKTGTGLLALQIGKGSPIQTLVREVQRHPVKHNVLHVDFQEVSMTQKLRLDIPIASDGEAPALANPDLVLVRNLDQVEVECLPGDIPGHIVADIRKLQTPDDEVLVKDLIVPAGVKILTDGTHLVFSLTFSRAAVEEEEAPAEAAPTAEVEVVAKGKAAKEGAEAETEEKEKK